MVTSGGPRITVITVCFNSKTHIGEALRSVDAQTWSDIEHIVIDGASTDGTLQILEAHCRGRRILSAPDRGIYDAMNKGLALATGDFVGFLNADDLFASADSLAAIAAAAAPMNADPRPDAIYGDLVYVRELDTGSVVRQWRSGSYSRGRLRYGWMPPHPTFYLRRDIFERTGGFDTSMRISADYDLMLRCLARPGFKAVYVPQVLVRMRLGGASNRSVRNLIRKSREDLTALRRSGIGGIGTLACKNLRKLPQFL
jgi:glycosyltransferase